jgi:hypothetical protein
MEARSQLRHRPTGFKDLALVPRHLELPRETHDTRPVYHSIGTIYDLDLTLPRRLLPLAATFRRAEPSPVFTTLTPVPRAPA